MFQINGELFLTIDACARRLGIPGQCIAAILQATPITSWWIEGMDPQYFSLREMQAVLAAEQPVSFPAPRPPKARTTKPRTKTPAAKVRKPRRTRQTGGGNRAAR